ncbi:MAG: radical SAM protein [Armatimonadota bacterium]|nr:MAG: radical SAM protein [Armatimonadota bacterium]
MSDEEHRPSYLALADSGELRRRARQAWDMLQECDVCARYCRVNRLEGKLGTCRTGKDALISSHGPHFGEETPLVGARGSGTIFLTNCNLKCIFCQNYDISHEGHGTVVTSEALAGMLLELQSQGCHNINFVSPSHQVPQILAALVVAVPMGLRVPLVYNTGGYDSPETLALLDGIFDIYMPDCKYADNDTALRLSDVGDYWDRNRAAVREMHRQVGDLQLDERSIATRGLLVRHLVLPHDLAGTEQVMEFLASLSKDTYVNVMAQYRPCYHAADVPELTRRITAEEYDRAVRAAHQAGLHRLDERWRLL